MKALESQCYALWFYIIQLTDVPGITDVIREYVIMHEILARAKDDKGRIAVDMATQESRLAIQSVFLWFGRYRITETHPEHTSATCFVYKALDEGDLDSGGRPRPVALKLIRLRQHFLREIETREFGFEDEYVVSILRAHPNVTDAHARPEDSLLNHHNITTDQENGTNVQDVVVVKSLNKLIAEKMYCIVMPLADRNMFVALKQERFAGVSDLSEVKHIFKQIVACVLHMHTKKVLHGDIKALNIVRTDARWKLIDLDASCILNKDAVGVKYSTAFVPPEALVVSADTTNREVYVRSEENIRKYGLQCETLIAYPSFDIWSLGCLLYHLCNPEVKPLFQGGQDDNLSNDISDEDSIWALLEWRDAIKKKKLSKIKDSLAANLISIMLSKDPKKRPSLTRILAHPFLSSKAVVRLQGEQAQYDIFISYRVASDHHHAELLYNLMSKKGLKVWWDKKCLKAGEPWQNGFCNGLVNSKVFMCLISKEAINHPTKSNQNFGSLTTTSPCDNVFLEYRLALELQGMGLIEKIFPVVIGEAQGFIYKSFHGPGCWPEVKNESVLAVEEVLNHHLESQALGSPLVPNRTVADVFRKICELQGSLICGDGEIAFENTANTAVELIREIDRKIALKHSEEELGIANLNELNLLRHENKNLKERIVALTGELSPRSFPTVGNGYHDIVARNSTTSPAPRKSGPLASEANRVITLATLLESKEEEIRVLREQLKSAHEAKG